LELYVNTSLCSTEFDVDGIIGEISVELMEHGEFFAVVILRHVGDRLLNLLKNFLLPVVFITLGGDVDANTRDANASRATDSGGGSARGVVSPVPLPVEGLPASQGLPQPRQGLPAQKRRGLPVSQWNLWTCVEPAGQRIPPDLSPLF
jgi:hypothetical protein